MENEHDVVVKAMVVGGETQGQSQQIPETKDDFDAMYGVGAGVRVAKPPFNPEYWSQTPEFSTRLKRCINTRARNTVGLGWDIALIEEIQGNMDKLSDAEKAEIKEQKDFFERLFKRPNRKMSFRQLMDVEKVDEESTGTGYVEAVRDNRGELIAFYHAPSKTMRVRRDGEGFVQIRGSKKRYFKHFGDRRVFNAETGEEAKGKGLDIKKRATEILQFSIYTPLSSFYGAPRYTTAATAITGNWKAGVRNVNFIDNEMVAPFLIAVSGGQLDSESMEFLRNMFEEKHGGYKKAGRCIVLQTEKKSPGPVGEGERTKIEIHKLSVGIEEDAAFLKYRDKNDDETREAMGLSEAYFSTKGVNRASAQESRQATIEEEFIPDLEAHEYVINECIMVDFLKEDLQTGEKRPWGRFSKLLVRFRFKRPRAEWKVDRAKEQAAYAEAAALSIDEIRQEFMEPSRPAFDKWWSGLPAKIALLLLQLKAQGVEVEDLLEEGEGVSNEKALLSFLMKARRQFRKIVDQANAGEDQAA